MLKLFNVNLYAQYLMQPPSGGCVLKQASAASFCGAKEAATFGWLCVETFEYLLDGTIRQCSHLRVAVC